MSSTNKTTHYEFPQYIGSDIPNILTDINPAFETIDTVLYEQGQQITESEADLSTLEAAVTQATSDVTVMQGSIATMAGVLETTRALATDNKETIGQGTLDTVAQTLIGAANELNKSKVGKVLASYKTTASETWSHALTELFNKIDDISEIPIGAILTFNGNNPAYMSSTGSDLRFTYSYLSSSSLSIREYIVGSSSYAYNGSFATGGNTISEISSSAVGNEVTLEIVI